ncbi:transglycosylase domain-containing protein [Deinococcus radiophilus]|uniref:peptidoglycan glycosyltransferase n=1 Tax=Deinococcus radiophilus TaxID=32062 RepID=A0A431VZC8_9DEIO|nr:transglycosylase domain-containing protein [Deinococcus radiophilus]RTR28620.1 penicillin-binding protein [Deinococcus radiophilus]UFA51042.1 penicillin-binding protein [Deinococcus radiophilus]
MILLGKFFKFFFSLLLAVVLAGAGLAGAFAMKWAGELPDYRELDSLTLGAETRVFARDGTPLGTLVPRVGEQKVSRTLVRLNEISPFMTAAVVANEDRTFFQHYGLDPRGIGRQVLRVMEGQDVQGGSTLTNQLIKNTLLWDEFGGVATPDRKAKEWMLSVQVERSFTKEEVLQNYLNAIYWGDGGPVELYGVYSAAQSYFGKAPKDLTLGESAYMTVLIPNPYQRYQNYEQAYGLMKVLLKRMEEDGWITAQQRENALAEKVQPKGWQVQYSAPGEIASAELVDPKAKELRDVTTNRAPHFTQQVEQELTQLLGSDKVYGAGGLRVYTTLDLKVQNAVETASREAVRLPSGATLGATIMDPYTGEVLGMIGQKIREGEPIPDWNNAAQGQRQIGSTIKPLLYTVGLQTGLRQDHREEDRPVSFPCDTCEDGMYSPQNFEGATTFRNMTIREALDRSLNLVTVRLADRIGLEKFFGKLGELGIPPNDGTGLAAALGAIETTPINMAAAYAPFVNGGVYYKPRYITRIETARGEVLYDAGNENIKPVRVWSPQVAYLGLDMIRGVVNDLKPEQGGLASGAKFGEWSVAGKTGTSNGPKDLWFVGTTPLYTGAVWVGKQEGGDMPINSYSGVVNAPIWKRMMEVAHAGKTKAEYQQPPGILFAEHPDKEWMPEVKFAYIDPSYRDAATDVEGQVMPQQGARYSEVEWYPSDPSSTELVGIDRRTGRLATEFTPPEEVIMRRIRTADLPSYSPDMPGSSKATETDTAGAGESQDTDSADTQE